MNLTMKNGRIIIDGREFTGSNFKIDGSGRVTIDGVVQQDQLVGPVTVQVLGSVEALQGVGGDVTVSGNCGSVKTVSGNVRCADVLGDLQTVSGDVNCHAVVGNVKTVSGDVRGVK